jgi:hypothetical protein
VGGLGFDRPRSVSLVEVDNVWDKASTRRVRLTNSTNPTNPSRKAIPIDNRRSCPLCEDHASVSGSCPIYDGCPIYEDDEDYVSVSGERKCPGMVSTRMVGPSLMSPMKMIRMEIPIRTRCRLVLGAGTPRDMVSNRMAGSKVLSTNTRRSQMGMVWAVWAVWGMASIRMVFCRDDMVEDGDDNPSRLLHPRNSRHLLV